MNHYGFEYGKHKALWVNIADNIERAIEKYANSFDKYTGAYELIVDLKISGLRHINEDPFSVCNGCYACEAAVNHIPFKIKQRHEIHEHLCEYCPLKWQPCDHEDSLYSQLAEAISKHDTGHAKELCLAIANTEPYTDEEYEELIRKNACK